jgi:hypothetical protein
MKIGWGRLSLTFEAVRVYDFGLKHDRFQETHLATDETFPGGVILHLAIRLPVNCSNLRIEIEETL